jgi:hypothetical protein
VSGAGARRHRDLQDPERGHRATLRELRGLIRSRHEDGPDLEDENDLGDEDRSKGHDCPEWGAVEALTGCCSGT